MHLLHQTHSPSWHLTDLSMATLPSLGQPSEWSTLPRKELKPSARTQVPCKPQIITCPAEVFWLPLQFADLCFLKDQPRFSQSSPPSPSVSPVPQGCKVWRRFARGLQSLSRAAKLPRFYVVPAEISVSWSYVKISESDPLHMRPSWLGRWQGFSVAL